MIVRAEPNLLICWTDVDRDTGHDLELVRFRVDADRARILYRDTSQSPPTSASSSGTQTRLVGTWVSNDDDVGNGLFSYVGMNGAPLPYDRGYRPATLAHVEDPTQIREVHINLHGRRDHRQEP